MSDKRFVAPDITPEQRSAALVKAQEARQARAKVKHRLSTGELDPVEALDDEVVGRMPLLEFLRSLPGLGVARARAVVEEVGTMERRRVGGLGVRQRERLVRVLRDRYGDGDARAE